MSKNVVFYEKYRPKQLKNVIGQDLVVQILTKSCEKDTFHHSYLLSGKYGTGKTSVARILASIFTCENRQVGSAVVCGKCAACQSVHSGNSIDIYELDGASNSKVENTRSIIESSRYAPQQFNKKVFIIDECHKLSSTAITSLLKTLEEPASTSVFILCTTEYSKVPKEIVSRCQRLHFKPVVSSTISDYIEMLFKHLNVIYEKSATDLIGSSVGGSIRDALQVAQSACVVSSNNVTEKVVADILGATSRELMYNLVNSISDKDLIRSIDIMETMFSSNIDCRIICDDLSCIFRNLMLATISDKFISDLTVTEKNFLELSKLKFTRSELVSFLDVFEEAQKALDININNKWVMESVIIKLIDKIVDK